MLIEIKEVKFIEKIGPNSTKFKVNGEYVVIGENKTSSLKKLKKYKYIMRHYEGGFSSQVGAYVKTGYRFGNDAERLVIDAGVIGYVDYAEAKEEAVACANEYIEKIKSQISEL